MKTKIASLLAVTLLTLPLFGASAKGKPLMEGVVNINTASVEELTRLPGIGKSKAEAIVTYRQAHPFKAVSELTEVKGIGPKMLEKIQGHVTLEGPTSLKEATALPARPTGAPLPTASR